MKTFFWRAIWSATVFNGVVFGDLKINIYNYKFEIFWLREGKLKREAKLCVKNHISRYFYASYRFALHFTQSILAKLKWTINWSVYAQGLTNGKIEPSSGNCVKKRPLFVDISKFVSTPACETSIFKIGEFNLSLFEVAPPARLSPKPSSSTKSKSPRLVPK